MSLSSPSRAFAAPATTLRPELRDPRRDERFRPLPAGRAPRLADREPALEAGLRRCAGLLQRSGNVVQDFEGSI